MWLLPSLLVVAWSCWNPSLGAETPSRGVWLDAVDDRALWVLAETQVVAETQECVSGDAEPWRTECKESNKCFSKQFNSWRRCRFNKHKQISGRMKRGRQQRRRRRPRQRQGKESEQAKLVSQGAPAAVVPMGSESIRARLVDQTPSTDPSPNGVIGAR